MKVEIGIKRYGWVVEAWMGFAWGHMALKHSSQNFPCFNGRHVSNLGLPRHQNLCWTICWNLTCFNGGVCFDRVSPYLSIKICDSWKLQLFNDGYVLGVVVHWGVKFKRKKGYILYVIIRRGTRLEIIWAHCVWQYISHPWFGLLILDLGTSFPKQCSF